MKGDCTRCGACCTLVICDHDQDKAADPKHSHTKREIHWIQEELVPITLAEAQKVNPRIDGGYQKDERYFRCSNVDPGTMLCTIHKDRPLTCRLFPWATLDENPTHPMMAPECGYHADVPRSKRAGCARMAEIVEKLNEIQNGVEAPYAAPITETWRPPITWRKWPGRGKVNHGDTIPCWKCKQPWVYKRGQSICNKCAAVRDEYLREHAQEDMMVIEGEPGKGKLK